MTDHALPARLWLTREAGRLLGLQYRLSPGRAPVTDLDRARRAVIIGQYDDAVALSVKAQDVVGSWGMGVIVAPGGGQSRRAALGT